MTRVEKANSRRRIVARVLFVGYTAAILAVTMWPKPVTEGANKVIIEKVLAVGREAGAPDAFDFHSLQFVANIVMFVPFGLFLALSLAPRLAWIGGVAAFAFTSAIEVMQQLFLPERSGDVWDVVANTAGGIVGVVLVSLKRRFRRVSNRHHVHPKQRSRG